MRIKTVKQIDVSDWDDLVIETYGKIYSFQQQDGCKPRGIETISTSEKYLEDFENDAIPEIVNGEKMGISFKTWLERDPNSPLNPSDTELKKCSYYWGEDKEEWKSDKSNIGFFWYRNFYPHANAIANDLYKRGLLEEGEYQIVIDW
jgi:hypothetical protein